VKKNVPPLVVAAAVAVVVGLTACSSANSATTPGSSGGSEVTTLRYQGSANAVSLPEIAADLGYLGDIKLKWVGNTVSGPQDIQSAATDQTDFGGAFTGSVVKLIEAGAPVKAVINYYGTDAKTFQGYYALDSSPIRSAQDLIGKKIGVNALGANAEAVIDTYLSKNGLSASEIKQVQLVVVPPSNTEEAIRKGQIDVGMLSGVLQDHAIAMGGLRSVFSDYTIFGAYNGGQYVFRDDFIEKNPDTIKTFVTAVAKAIEWEQNTPRGQVIAEFTKIINGRGRNESASNLQYWQSVGIASKGGAISDQDFTEWTGWLQSAGIIKGALDPPKYYTNAYTGLAASGTG
jgi:ABC-type nitrate/sulfonate/bicarbonate transport system substrate-binding protein